MAQANIPNPVVRTERLIAFSRGRSLPRSSTRSGSLNGGGPDGFRNTFEQFEFAPGGRWVFVMHGPNAANYPNDAVFREIEPDIRIVIEHVSPPRFTLSISLTAEGDQTRLTWFQEFESPELAERMRPICEPANEQNLDRLESHLASDSF